MIFALPRIDFSKGIPPEFRTLTVVPTMLISPENIDHLIELPGRIGQGGWSWYTGSAAWMYRAWVEEVLGLKVCGDRMQLNPVIPGWWEGFHLRYRHGEAIYEIQVENPEGCERGVSWVEMDGQRVRDGVIPLDRALVKHRILVHMGKPEQAA